MPVLVHYIFLYKLPNWGFKAEKCQLSFFWSNKWGNLSTTASSTYYIRRDVLWFPRLRSDNSREFLASKATTFFFFISLSLSFAFPALSSSSSSSSTKGTAAAAAAAVVIGLVTRKPALASPTSPKLSVLSKRCSRPRKDVCPSVGVYIRKYIHLQGKSRH